MTPVRAHIQRLLATTVNHPAGPWPLHEICRRVDAPRDVVADELSFLERARLVERDDRGWRWIG